ncbi:MAG TPA: hypothetical protein VKS25_04970 [Solirubrobacteraceae bacterium]|nr:hypothetical protein [Solirubrobacteraceae bacterium]
MRRADHLAERRIRLWIVQQERARLADALARSEQGTRSERDQRRAERGEEEA